MCEVMKGSNNEEFYQLEPVVCFVMTFLQAWRLDVCYWQEKIPGQFDNFPVFIAYGKDYNLYALPSEEYPGLIKVCLCCELPGCRISCWLCHKLRYGSP